MNLSNGRRNVSDHVSLKQLASFLPFRLNGKIKTPMKMIIISLFIYHLKSKEK